MRARQLCPLLLGRILLGEIHFGFGFNDSICASGCGVYRIF